MDASKTTDERERPASPPGAVRSSDSDDAPRTKPSAAAAAEEPARLRGLLEPIELEVAASTTADRTDVGPAPAPSPRTPELQRTLSLPVAPRTAPVAEPADRSRQNGSTSSPTTLQNGARSAPPAPAPTAQQRPSTPTAGPVWRSRSPLPARGPAPNPTKSASTPATATARVPDAPAVTSPAPVAAPVAPVAEPVAPVAEPVAPVAEPVAPVAEPDAPVAEPVAPVATPIAPVNEPVAPVSQPGVAAQSQPVADAVPPAGGSLPPIWAPETERPHDRRRRSTFVLGLVAVAMAGVLGLVAMIVTMVDSNPSAQPRADVRVEPSAAPEATQPDRSTPAPTSAGTSAGSGTAPADGLAVAAAVISPTTIEIVETVGWPDGGPAEIELELPADAASTAGLAIAPEPVIESLQVSVDGSPVVATLRDGTSNAWVIRPPTGAAPSSMVVRYLLEGAIVHSVPAVPGRALAVVTPISAGAARDLPVTLAISATDVLNVYCPAGTTQAAIRCGRLEDDHWVVTLPPGLPLVVAQLDLPGVI